MVQLSEVIARHRCGDDGDDGDDGDGDDGDDGGDGGDRRRAFHCCCCFCRQLLDEILHSLGFLPLARRLSHHVGPKWHC